MLEKKEYTVGNRERFTAAVAGDPKSGGKTSLNASEKKDCEQTEGKTVNAYLGKRKQEKGVQVQEDG